MITHDEVPEALAGLAYRLPRWLLDIELLEQIHTSHIGIPDDVTLLLSQPECVERVDGGLESVRQVFRQCCWTNDWAKLEEMIITQVGSSQARVELIPFPPEPCRSTKHLQALTSRRQVKREGRRMKNCAAWLLSEILSGYSYLFHWTGDQAATVHLKRNPSEGNRWSIETIATYGNGKANDSTELEIMSEIFDALEGALRPKAWSSDTVFPKILNRVVRRRVRASSPSPA